MWWPTLSCIHRKPRGNVESTKRDDLAADMRRDEAQAATSVSDIRIAGHSDSWESDVHAAIAECLGEFPLAPDSEPAHAKQPLYAPSLFLSFKLLLEDSMRGYRTVVNETPCLVSRLPTEILRAIFIECARDHYCRDHGQPTYITPSWVNVSYVSRHWRSVALNCATLWGYLFVVSPRWTVELLYRSRQAPLKLTLINTQLKRNLGPHFFDYLTEHLERIQELRLHLPDLAYDDYGVLSKLNSPASRLQCLEISMDGWSPNSEWSGFLLFGGNSPDLRTLHLTNCLTPWYSLSLGRLTRLYLEDVPAPCRQDTMDFLATLRGMKNLEFLYLGDALASATGFLQCVEFRRFRKIDLPHLSQLCLFAPLSTVIALLSCIDIPLETTGTLGPDYHNEHELSSLEDYTPLYSLLAQRYSTSEDQGSRACPIIRSLAIAYSGSKYEPPRLKFYTSERGVYHPSHRLLPSLEWQSTVHLEIFLPVGIPSSDRHHLISRFCHSMPLQKVRSVHVIEPPSSAVLLDVLGRIQDLRRIKLSKGGMPDLTSLLSATPGHDGAYANEADAPFAPALEELELHDMTFSAASRRDALIPQHSTEVQPIYDALCTRKEPPGRLAITECVEVMSTAQMKTFNVEGRWGGGRFEVVKFTDVSWQVGEDSDHPEWV